MKDKDKHFAGSRFKPYFGFLVNHAEQFNIPSGKLGFFNVELNGPRLDRKKSEAI